MRFLAALALVASPAIAEPHYITTAMADVPCADALAYITDPKPDWKGAGNMGMAFGYLLGYQAATGGDLSGNRETILKRITADCDESPDKTALEILKGY